MLFITPSIAWSACVFGPLLYVTLVFSIILYLIPVLNETSGETFKIVAKKTIIAPFNLVALLALLLLNNWIAGPIYMWNGHAYFGAFQYKTALAMIVFFLFVNRAYLNFFVLKNRLVYDYLIAYHHLTFWLVFLFQTNSVVSLIFMIELLSAIIFVILASSSFAAVTTNSGNNMLYAKFFNDFAPQTQIKAIVLFFWISLLTSLNLFLFSILLYTKFATLDWTLLESLSTVINHGNTFDREFAIGLIWLSLLSSIFLKCGVAPFFFWKPTFFKGLPWHVLFAYITIFYFFLIVFFIYFIVFCVPELFLAISGANLLIIVFGIALLISSLTEAYLVKTFLALSSILNTLFVFVTLIAMTTFDVTSIA